jgi:hypothetical protein
MPDVASLIAELRRVPLANAASLIRALQLGSQSSLSRLVTSAGPQVVAIGRARARRYAAARDIRGLGYELPLFRVDPSGILQRIAIVRPFAPEGVFVAETTALSRWMQGHQRDGVFGGLPIFLSDQRPQGFLGRTFARRNQSLGMPDKLEDWSDDDAMLALAKAGEDQVGDLILGDESARRLYANWAEEPRFIAFANRIAAYPALAEEAIGGLIPGSSAGGEQPKFGAILGEPESPIHVIVKFTPPDNSLVGQRWRDLLICEHLALQALRGQGFPTVDSELLESGSRAFLQTTRFDRVGLRGRLPVVTLFAMNSEYVGMPPGAGHWLEAVERLEADRWLLPSTVAQVRGLETFGRFIANTDMHFGNLSFLPDPNGQMTLAPVYDMLPMYYAPIGNDLPPRKFAPPLPEPGQEAAWFQGGEWALGYWEAVARDERISESFRTTAAENATAIRNATTRFTSGR